jgi:hypothetical protein
MFGNSILKPLPKLAECKVCEFAKLQKNKITNNLATRIEYFNAVAYNVLGLTQSGPGKIQAGEIGYLAFSSQFTPAVELKQTWRARIAPSRMLAAMY